MKINFINAINIIFKTNIIKFFYNSNLGRPYINQFI